MKNIMSPILSHDFRPPLNISLLYPVARLSIAMDLPFEIWLHIASFIPTDQLGRLSAVNHIFYAIVMTDRCKVTDFCKETGTIAGSLPSLGRLSNAQRVRTLNLYPDVLADYLSRQPKPGWGSKTKIIKPTRLYKHTGIPVTRHDKWTANVKAQMLQLVGSMSEVVDFSITTRGYTPRSQFRDQIVVAGWNAFGSALQNLRLVAPLGEENFPLEPTCVFPCLEHLAIELSCFECTDGTKLVRDLLVPFVNNHQSTLRSLEISLKVYGQCNVFAWFSGIRHLPHLTKLAFCCHFPTKGRTGPESSPLWHLLTLHSEGLSGLELKLLGKQIPEASEWYTQPSRHVALPRLESLCVTLDSFSDPIQTPAYLRQFKNSLRTLKLTGKRLPYHEVEMIVHAFEGRDILRVLHVEVDHLGPALFDLLSEKLPSLDDLHLVFLWVTSAFRETFRETMQQSRSYSGWKLRHFTARPYLHVEHDFLADWQDVIRDALPHLQTLRIAHSD